jgi:hypothetical protein
MAANFDMNSYRIINTGAAVNDTDVPNFGQVESLVEASTLGIGRHIFNVKVYGATGNGVTNDTAAIQTAINKARDAGGGIVYFPSGTYMVTSINVTGGLTLLGTGSSVIKRPASQPNWTRTVTTSVGTYYWNQSYDSPPLEIRGLVFDGNRDAQGAYIDYQLEQAHLLFLAANPASAGRLRVIIDSCVFKNSVADGISVYTNVDLSVSNTLAYQCFRGGLVISGGHSKVQVNNMAIRGVTASRGLDVEIDGMGYNNSLVTNIAVSNMEVNGSVDITTTGSGSVVQLTNVYYGDISQYAQFYIYIAPTSVFQATNCNFLLPKLSAGTFSQLRYTDSTQFVNCTFTFYRPSATGDYHALVIYAENKRKVSFDSCKFLVAPNTNLTNPIYGLYFTASDSLTNHVTFVRDCEFGKDLNWGIYAPQGGFYRISDCYFDSTGGVYWGGGGTWPIRVELINPTIGANNTTLHYQGGNTAECTLVLSGDMDLASYNMQGITGDAWLLRGDFRLWATAPPSSGMWVRGQKVYHPRPDPGGILGWVCTTSGSPGTWKAFGVIDL